MHDPVVQPAAPVALTPQESASKGVATFVYALQAASVLTGVTLLVAVIVNYVKLNEARGTWVETHFRWQIRTFWYSLLLGLLLGVVIVLLTLGAVGAAAGGSDAGAAGAAVSAGLLGMAGGLAIFVWFAYRVVKGWMRLSENQPI